MTGEKYIFYGNEWSYFSMKLCAALHWGGFAFEMRRKTIELTQWLERRSGTHRIPVLETPEKWIIDDTTPICRLLDGRISFPSSTRRKEGLFYPSGTLGALAAVLEEYFDEWFPRIVVLSRWSTEEENRTVAGRRLGQATAGEGADPEAVEAMSETIQGWGRKVCRALGVDTPESAQAAIAEMHRVLTICDAIVSTRPFLLGSAPTAVDCVLMGALKAHLFADPCELKTLPPQYPNLWRWFKQNDPPLSATSTTAPPFPLLHCADSEPGMPSQIDCLLAEINRPEAWVDVTQANCVALKEGRKAFNVRIHGVETSVLTRSYPEHSRQMLIRFIEFHLPNVEERGRFVGSLPSRVASILEKKSATERARL
uniref:GST N-terminal domain-containing protein n=1 Tax=Chromera velia CCMP2878 TaxID=1169474 RepID=A0A0G4HB72_9ALVE|eukprot:Cvel_25868.t1-p1 / transcript=Cvel_25868.t1 / gene=Cvel_25868 / organism=Chromera_velia_CCMP2878 / gene_product=hypothetical protein / transcript_product=hypothetical protein / location=Cvel_scaffold2985:483-1586(-) / protein_length=368 / sequence_SO=supercontig / SO=protein_coding / is_pseudo=false